MGPLAQFLTALNNLVRSGAIKNIPQAIKFAELQFGKITPLLKKQIEKVFENIKKPVVGKPGKKEGTVIPMVKEGAKKAEGIETLEDSSPLMNRLDKKVEEMRLSDDDPMGDLEQILNPRRPGGSLDPATGITRALARRILDKKGIEIGKKDPINPFQPTPTGPVLPDKSMMADLGDEFISPEYQEEFRKFLMMLQESEKEQSRDNIMEMFKKYMLTKEPRVLEAATGGRVQAASGGLADILKV